MVLLWTLSTQAQPSFPEQQNVPVVFCENCDKITLDAIVTWVKLLCFIQEENFWINVFDSELNLALASLSSSLFPVQRFTALPPASSSYIPHVFSLRNFLTDGPTNPEMYIEVEEETEHKAFAQLGNMSCHDPYQFSSNELLSELSV